MDVVHEARTLLEEVGYATVSPDPASTMFYFEDDSLMGFIAAHASIDDILEHWEEQQDAFLRRHAIRIRAAPNKAWNVYSVYLTAAKCPPSLLSKLWEIEEDFRGTRKLVRSDIETRSDLKRALLTFLPIQNVFTLEAKDVHQRLSESLISVDPTLGDILGHTSADDLVRRLLEEE